ncbi:MAG: substrate-binding domain-containing protein [Treponema sp.]|nr:substrate-binding domain-containing protein [Treponema sp.]
MNKFALFLILFFISLCTWCKEADDERIDFDKLSSSFIEGLTFNNFPKVDGSTSNLPLNTVIACTLFGIDYTWVRDWGNLQRIEPNLNRNDTRKFLSLVKSSQTHQSFINLINEEADIILSARKMSPDEKSYADDKGVDLIEIPIALDGFLFVVHPDNPVESLTIKQIQDIYTGNITNWNELGGNHAEIQPYVRNANSGSQELMETLVMKDLNISLFPESYYELLNVIGGMVPVYETVAYENNAICYSLFYYKEYMITGINVKTIAINGIFPNKETIGNNSYPYVAEVYAVIRSDLDKSSMAYKLFQWLQTQEGQQTIGNSGYVPFNQ